MNLYIKLAVFIMTVGLASSVSDECKPDKSCDDFFNAKDWPCFYELCGQYADY